MKKQLLTLIGVTLLICNLSAQLNLIKNGNKVMAVTGNPKQKLQYKWDYNTSQFDTVGRELYTYNSNNKLVRLISQDTLAGSFENVIKAEISYNSTQPDQVDSSLYYFWANNLWDPAFTIINKYTTGGLLDSTKMGLGIFSLSIKYTYDVNNHPKTSVIKTGGQKTDSICFTVDVNGNILVEEGFKWDAPNSLWKKDKRITYTYNSSNLKTTEIHEQWNPSNSVYENLNKVIYTYDSNGNEITRMDQDWLSTVFSDVTKTSTYYTNGTEYDYQLVENWNGTSFESEFKYVWSDLVSSVASFSSMNKFSMNVFPNPSSDNATILFTNTQTGSVKVTVTDITGKQVMTLADGVMTSGIHTLNTNVSALTKGLYIINIQSGSTDYKQKWIVE